MTGSDMGALIFSFLRPVFFVLTLIAAALALFVVPWAWGFAACFLCAALWMHHAIKKYEARCARYSQESRDWLETSEPALYAAKNSASEQLKNLPGLKSMGLGTAFGPSANSDYGLSISVEADWQENQPQSVGGLPWAEWSANIPEQVDGFRIVVQFINAPNDADRFWTAQDGFSSSSWGKR